MRPHRLVLAIVFVAFAVGRSHAGIILAADVLNHWSQGPTPLGAGPSNNPQITWTLGVGGIETPNGSGGLLSDFTSSGDFSFSVRVRPISPEFVDNDLWGVTFGYVDSSNHYRLGWGGGGFTDLGPNGLGGTGATGLFLAKQTNGVGSILFNDANLLWQSDVDYDVTVFRQGSTVGFSVVRISDLATVGAATFADAAFPGGNVGVYVDSQATRFSNFDFSQTAAQVPEPSSLAVWGIAGLMTGRLFKRKPATAD